MNTTAISRLAVLARGDSAAQILSAVSELNRACDGPQICTVLVDTTPAGSAAPVWDAWQAQEVLRLGSTIYRADAHGRRRAHHLDPERVVAALRAAQVDAAWLSWGVAGDLAGFAACCEAAGIVVVGPNSRTMALLQSRIRLRELAAGAGVRVPAWRLADRLSAAQAAAAELGYPVTLLTAHGSGQRGTRTVAGPDRLAAAFADLQAESEQEARSGVPGAAERDPVVLLEAVPPRVRLVEADIVADASTVWVLPLRDCTVRQGGRLVLAECPCPGLQPEQEQAVRGGAERIARAIGYRGVGAVSFALGPEGEVYLTGVDVGLHAASAAVEEICGLDLVERRLHLARGGMLTEPAPPGLGHVAETRLWAGDPEQALTPVSGRIAMLELPSSTGVRIDLAARVGDPIAAGSEPPLARLTAWGRSRGEALTRLRRALDRTTAVVEGGSTDRSFLLTLLKQPELLAGPVEEGWLDRRLHAGAFASTADPMALLAAAVEAYAADRAAALGAFYATAVRGRPEQPEAVGTGMHLRYRGVPYEVRVDQVAPESYRVRCGTDVCDLLVHKVNAFERRIHCAGQHRTVVAVPANGGFHLEVDGASHRVSRDDGAPVRAAGPALVVSVLVSPGQAVQAGDPLVVLESMKMESTVLAPFPGEVAAVQVIANQQVDPGAPLLRIRPGGAPEAGGDERAAGSDPLDLSGLRRTEATGPRPCSAVYDALRNYLLGYDLPPAELTRLLRMQSGLALSCAPDDPALIRCEDSLLDLFTDVGSLYRPRTEADPAVADEQEPVTENTQEYLLAYLQLLDADRAGLPRRYRDRLVRALARYGVPDLRRSPDLESALFWMYRSFGRVPELAPVVLGILDRRLRYRAVLAPVAGPQLRDRFDRLAASTRGLLPEVSDLARDVRFRYLDEPVLEAVVAGVYADMNVELRLLRTDPAAADRERHISGLVSCPQPLRALLLRSWLDSLRREGDGSPEIGFRRSLLEVYVRRFYRIRALGPLQFPAIADVGVQEPGSAGTGAQPLLAVADYLHEGHPVHLVVAYTPLADLPAVSRAVAAHLTTLGTAGTKEDEPARPRIVVDLAAWRPEEQPPIDDTAAQVAELLRQCDFGRPLHRLDLTVTSTVGAEAEHRRTQHLTYRQSASGEFGEEQLYRNLHPMLAKRLGLWRLRNFRLQRLASPEDIYLFLGEAYQNSKDRRLFALAEVRDLTPSRDPETGAVSYPCLERIWSQALADMRAALAGWAPRERPLANRLVLVVRPPWDLPRNSWHPLIRTFAPMARGAGLEKVVLRVLLPDPSADGGLRDTVLHLEGVERQGVTVRAEPPGDQPIRPLTEYRQKVLIAQRFRVPYPYEIIRILGHGRDAASEQTAGTFVEYDLDDKGDLVPVNREPGHNTAHLVVGLATTYTDVVPEGITRVAILSDPTMGLGNLAAPECQRINAALDLAERLRVPVEWFAVSSGALIAMDSGTENMDWIAATLRRLIEFTQAGGEVNIVVTGINVGGQPYWNAEATMLMHTKGILVMTPASAMVLTGKQALDFSGGVSADDNAGIGGYDRVMGLNGQAQYWAPTFEDACRILLRHYDFSYVVPGERFPRRRPVTDPIDRDVRTSPHTAIPGSDFSRVGDVFDPATNPERKKPFDIRSVLRAVCDTDSPPLERWERWHDGETSVVWDAHIGGIPVSLLGLESRPLPRRGLVPADGPLTWTSGTLFPQSSRKTARAINAASGVRPLVVLANLSGFDGSPESMRNWQLEYGAQIGRAVTNFEGPIVFVVISRYHGGAFVVFSKALNENLEIAAVEGSYASVIGGAPAAATVFAREVKTRTDRDTRVQALRAELSSASGGSASALRTRLALLTDEVRSEKLGEVAAEFDSVHTIERALKVGSVDRIIQAGQLRPYVVDALERGMARVMAADQPPAQG